MWYARPIRVDTEALARAKSITAETVRQCKDAGVIEQVVAAQEPTPVTNWDVSCPWCGAIALLKVRGRTREGRFYGGFDCAECRVHRVQNGDAKDIDAYASAFMDLMREQASKQAMMARNPDPLDALRREKIMHARPFPGIASLVGEAFGPCEVTGGLKPYPREETGIIGNNTLPLSEELRAIVYQFYQESMTHARESGSLPYALSHAP